MSKTQQIDREKQLKYYNNTNELIRELNERLIERDELVRIVILALCSHNHMFLLGERGVAKSMTVEMTNDVIEGSRFWQLQVGKDTQTEELLGEKKSKEDGTVYYSSKKSLLNANVAVLDEIFKADGKMLNVLLEILVDNAYTSGDGVKKSLNLISLFGTSNEFPTDTFMLPLLDRFMFFYEVKRIQNPENRRKFYSGSFNQSKIEKKYFNMDDMFFIKNESKKITIPGVIIEIFESITGTLTKQGVKTSDRKYWKALQTVIKTMAYLNNRTEVNVSDLFMLLHTSWHDYAEKDKVRRVIFEKIFGVKDEIDGIVIKVKKRIDEIDAFRNDKLYDYLNFRREIEGEDKNSFFNSVVEAISSVFEAYHECESVLNTLYNKYQNNIEIEKMCENNIFVINYKQKAFSYQTVSEIEALISFLGGKMDLLMNWYQENKTLYDYQKNLYSRKKSA